MKVITIGRSSKNNIVINDPYVGRHHCQIVENYGRCSIVNIDAKNGTFVNGKKICGETTLSPMDIVKIGNTVLPWQTYIPPPSPPPAPAPSPYGIWVLLLGLVSLGLIAYIVITFFTSFTGRIAGGFGGTEGLLKWFPFHLRGHLFNLSGQWVPMIAALILSIVASFINGVLIESEQEDSISKAGKGLAGFALGVSILFLILAIFAPQIAGLY